MQEVEWGEFRIEDVLEWQPQKEIDPLKLEVLLDKNENYYPFYGQSTTNNGVISYNQLVNSVLNNKEGKPTILIHSNNQNIVYVKSPFYLKDGHGATSVLQCEGLNDLNQMFIVAAIDKVIKEKYNYNNKATKIELKNTIIQLPIKNGEIDFDFMERFIAELEQNRMQTLQAYLQATGLDNAELTVEEQEALANYDKLEFGEFNLEVLFGKATRGKRLKSDDRITGNLPFITAGEANEGFSAYVGNAIEVFNSNTITIDMFGSAKYRNYKYGADDHVAVVKTEKINKFAAIFITTAIHKVSYNGQFNYGRNFYAKDADVLNIQLPTKNAQPDYASMELLISAIQKLVIKDVLSYTSNKLNN